MPFDVGDKVVYPHHGAATIEKREKKDAFGKKQDYLVLRLAYGDLTLMVPADNAEEIGLRDVINDEEVEEVFAVLRKKEARMPTNWSRRFKNHVEKLKSGDIYQVAEVVRNLSIREKDKGLSAGEKRMLAQGPPDPRVGAHVRAQRRRGDRRGAASTRCSRARTSRAKKPGQEGRRQEVGGACGCREAACGRSSSPPGGATASARPKQFCDLAGTRLVDRAVATASAACDARGGRAARRPATWDGAAGRRR